MGKAKPLSQTEIDRIVELYQEGLSMAEIHRRTGRAATTRTSSFPLGSEEYTAPCFRQNEHWQARRGSCRRASAECST